MSRPNKSYNELLQIPSFKERFSYLSLNGAVGNATFGFDRWLNQIFYTSKEWRDVRQFVIARDEGLDLGVAGYEIFDSIVVHHIIPIVPDDLEQRNPLVLDPNNLITTCHQTHNAIHYGDERNLKPVLIDRSPGDTRLW